MAASLLLATAAYGFFILSHGVEGERMTVALIQGNILADYDRSASYREATLARREAILDRYESLTREAAQQSHPVLVVWPEGAIPGDIEHDPELKMRLARLASETQSYLLIGNSPYAKFSDRKWRGKYFNSASMVSPQGGIAEGYQKVVLVPFGEYNPLSDVIEWPDAMATTTTNIVPGERFTLFSIGPAAFSATICWENIFPEHVRGFVRRGARFIVNITNEGWYGDTSVPYQLLAISAFRAVENRVPVARASNNGISAFIDPLGRITQRLRGADGKELFVDGTLVGEVQLSQAGTFYTRWGDIFALFQIAFVLLLLLYSRFAPTSVSTSALVNQAGGETP